MPVKYRTRICFSARSNVTVTDYCLFGNVRIMLAEQAAHPGQLPILGWGVGLFILPLQFDTDREIITGFAALKTGLAGVPGAFRKRYILHQFTIAPDQQMAGNPAIGYFGKISMRSRIQPVTEKIVNPGATVLARRALSGAMSQ